MDTQAYQLIKTLEASINLLMASSPLWRDKPDISLSKEWEMCFYWDTPKYLAHATVYVDGTYSFKVVAGDKSCSMGGLECETPFDIDKILEGLANNTIV